jgi:hypothetical protein
MHIDVICGSLSGYRTGSVNNLVSSDQKLRDLRSLHAGLLLSEMINGFEMLMLVRSLPL